MDKSIRARAPLRSAVTKTINEAEAEMAKAEMDIEFLEIRLRKLERVSAELQELDQKILDSLLDTGADEATYETEYSSIEMYRDKVDTAVRKIYRILPVQMRAASPPPNVLVQNRAGSPTPSDIGIVASNGTKKKSYKLPKIELKKFSGDILEWLEFWSQYEKIHSDEDLHDADKFHYLAQSMVPESRAHKLVSGYPKTAENYPKVVEALLDRFGDKVLLSEVYVRNLLKLVSHKKKSSLPELHDELESHLRSLESLGIVTDQSAIFLYPMVESSLPEEIIKVWQRCPLAGYDEDGKDKSVVDRLNALRKFLRQEVKGEERLSFVTAGLEESKKEGGQYKRRRRNSDEPSVSTAAQLFTGQISCIFCEKSHESRECFKAQDMTMEEKKSIMQIKKCCFNCMKPGHSSKSCRVAIKCMACQKKHYPLMCPELHKNKSVNSNKNEAQTSATYLNCSTEVLLQTLLVQVVGKNYSPTVRLVFDNGSQKSYVRKDTVQRLGNSVIGHQDLVKSLFGGNTTACVRHNKYLLVLKSLDGKSRHEIEALDESTLCGLLPKVPYGPWMKELQKRKIWINDFHSGGKADIEILVGSDYYGQLLTGKIVHLSGGLTAFETIFGWTLGGRLPHSSVDSSVMLVTSMIVHDAAPSQLWDLETIGIRDPAESIDKAEQDAQLKKEFLKTVARTPDGRYSVRLPWINGVQNIPNNFNIALRRLNSTTMKLTSKGKLQEYGDIFQGWLNEGMIEEVRSTEGGIVHYLPHHPVFKPSSLTTPVRPVFDASCKVGRSPSLNDCLHKGPNLMELIPDILHRFREGRIGVVSDVRKAFMMIEIDNCDRDVLRFLWWENATQEKVKIFRHRRVVFGVNCSPFILAAVIEAHLDSVSIDRKEISRKLLKSIYVDNCVTSVDTQEEYKNFKTQATTMFAEAKMELRLWECTSQENTELLKEKEFTSVLGLKWDKVEDTLSFEIPILQIQESLTKRDILSQCQKIFDPLGILCPVLIKVKILLQKTWAKKIHWDDVGEEIRTAFLGWWEELDKLRDVKIPRCATAGSLNRSNWQIHTFCDASMDAYSATVFLRVGEEGNVSVQLLQAKSRVAPMKVVSIPRLELLSCCIVARLTKCVTQALSAAEIPIQYWSDSTTALAWVKRNDNWGTFVGNRVKEICNLSDATLWRHVPGAMNPADLPSRGCTPKELLESRWWEGPRWLYGPPDSWPNEVVTYNEEAISHEKRKVPLTNKKIRSGTPEVTAVHHIGSKSPGYPMKYSSYSKNIRVLAYMLRFLDYVRRKYQRKNSPLITVPEFNEAEKKMWIAIQLESFPGKEENILGLRVQRDDDQLIHVKTKLIHRQDTELFRLPILLPHSHEMVDRLIREEHNKNEHAGIQFLMSHLREKFWIVQGRSAIRKVVTSCVICRRHETKAPLVVPAPLPEDRTASVNVFQNTGVDLAGPLHLKDKSKVWIVLFTCAVYRCVHLELVTSLSTETFLLSLFRFISRRGRPTIVYSDNGTNFVGAVNLFEQLDWERIEREANVHQITWKFNPPSAPWWGGWWESLIQYMKNLLKRTLGCRKLNLEELTTCLCQVEGVMNDRPLTYVTEDLDDLIPLTPSMFLKDVHCSEVPELEVLDAAGLRKSYQGLRQVLEEIRSRFRNEYLGLLVQKANEKKTHEYQTGDVVLIGSDNKKRLEWPMGRIIELISGKDGESRVARVKTATGEFLRPIQRLYPLEVHSATPDIPIEKEVRRKAKILKEKVPDVPEPDVITRFGRKVKRPERF